MSDHECCGGANHGVNGGCGGCGGGCGGGMPPSDGNPLEIQITPAEEHFLGKLAQCPFLPVAQFLLRATNPEEQNHMSLEPVLLETGKESLEEIKNMAQVLLLLEHKNLISLDYSSPLEGCDSAFFQQSEAFLLLEKTVEDATQNGENQFLPPEINQGSVCLTAIGELVVEQLDFT